MTKFLTDWGVVVALACAGCAVLYGAATSRWLLAKSPGNEEMQRISAAVQEGAKAYLARQYQIIAGVAVVLFVVLGVAIDWRTAIGFAIGGTFSGSAGFIGMNVSVRSNARVAEQARSGVPAALDVAFKGGAITGLLVAGLALLGVLTFQNSREVAIFPLVIGGVSILASIIGTFAVRQSMARPRITNRITATPAMIWYWRVRYALAPSCTAAEMRCISSLPGDFASSQRVVTAP